MKLEQWYLGYLYTDGYTPPELNEQVIYAKVGDKMIRTSPPVSTNGEYIKTRSGSIYTLGEPDPDYEIKFPNARQQLIDSLPKEQHV